MAITNEQILDTERRFLRFGGTREELVGLRHEFGGDPETIPPVLRKEYVEAVLRRTPQPSDAQLEQQKQAQANRSKGSAGTEGRGGLAQLGPRALVYCLGIFLAASATYILASPYVSLSGLGTAIENADAADLEERVDFPALREALKAESKARVMEDSAKRLSGNPFAALAVGLASNLVDSIVDAAVTPSGLARLASGDATPRQNDSRKPRARNKADPFSDARIDRESMSRFSVWVPVNDSSGEIRFVFRRRGLSWVLTSIEIPDE